MDKPNYFNVKVWGAQGENAARFLSKGRPVAIDGRLEWREWEAQDGTKRQAIDIIADSVQFLGSRDDSSGGGGFAGNGATPQVPTPPSTKGTFSPRRSAPRPVRRHPVLEAAHDIPCREPGQKSRKRE